MAETTVEIGQRAVPMLSYEDVGAAIDWLCRSFGLREPMDEPYGRPDNAADHEGHRWMFMQNPSE